MFASQLEEFGGPEVLTPRDVPAPLPRTGWTRVHLSAAALNWHDTLVRAGVYNSPLPIIPGSDGAGTTDEGDRVIVFPSLFWGDREAAPSRDWEILGDYRNGTYAEVVKVPAECALPVPTGMSWAEAAALPLVGVTVYRALFTRGGLKRGESLLIIGASGGVATYATKLASAMGVHVAVTSAAPQKLTRAKEIGAVAGIDHTAADWTSQARTASPDNEGFDLVLDPVGRTTEALECLRPGGRCVVLGSVAHDEVRAQLRPFYFAQKSVLGTTMGSPADMRGLLDIFKDVGPVAPIIDRAFGLDQAAAAHRHLENGEGFGKTVLTVT